MINRLTRFAILIAALTVAILGGVVLPAAAETRELGDGVTVTGPDEVTVGQGITISGTGWLAPSGAGSVIAVKLDGGIKRTTPIKDPVSQEDRAADIFAVVPVGADGSFTTTVEFPTTANATKTWSAGSKGSLRLLTGKLLDGDQVRSVEVSFEVVSGTETAPSPTKSAETSTEPDTEKSAETSKTPDTAKSTETSPAQDTEKPAEIRMLPQVEPTTPAGTTAPRVTAAASCSDKLTVKLTGESTSGGKPAAPLGGNLKLEGTGWCVENGSSGSVIVIKIDEPGRSYEIVNPQHGANDIWDVINVGNDGTFNATVKVPRTDELRPEGRNGPTFTSGSHYLRLLTGSSKDGDVMRSRQVDFVATGGSSTSSPTSTSTTSSTSTNSTSNNSSTNSTSSKLAATGGSRPVVLVIGLILIVAGIAVLRPEGAHSDLGRNDS